MDELKDKEVSDSTVMELCKETVMDRVAGEDSEKIGVVEPVGSEVQVEAQAVTKGVVMEEGGSCNGVDIMVGVMGSDIYVDGVCIQDFGNVAVDSGVDSSNLGAKTEVRISCGVAECKKEEKLLQRSNGDSVSKTENEVEISSGIAESEEEEKLEEGSHGVAGDSGLVSTVDSEVETSSMETENEVGKSSGVEESKEEEELEVEKSCLETEEEARKFSTVAESKEEEKLVISDSGGNDLFDDKTSHEVGIVNDQTMEIGFAVESSPRFENSSGGEIEVVDEKVAVATGKEREKRGRVDAIDDVNSQEVEGGCSSAVAGSSKDESKVVAEKSELIEKEIYQANERNGSGEVEVGVLHEEVWNPGIVEEEVVMANGENSMEGVVPTIEKDSVSTEKDPIAIAIFKSFDEQTRVMVDGAVASMGNKEISCTNMEGMETDDYNENFCFSVEELQATFETAKRSTENHYDEYADMQSSQQQTRVVGGEVAASDNKVNLHSEDGKQLLIAECSDRSMPHDSARVHTNVKPDTWEEQGNIQTTNDSTENHSTVDLDSATLCYSAQVVDDNKVHSNHNFEGPIHGPVDGVLASSGNDQHIQHGTQPMETDTEIAIVSELPEKDRKLNMKECLGKRERDTARVDSDVGQVMDAEEQVSHVEDLGPDDRMVAKQNTKADDAVCASTETDIRVMDVGQTAIANTDSTSRPDTGLDGTGEGDSGAMVGRKTISLAKVSTTAPSLPKPSFKIGECIRRVASQMTGSPSMLKANSHKQDGTFDGLVGDGFDVSSQHSEDTETRKMTARNEYSSLDELLSQLYLAARDHSKGYSSLSIIVSFFSNFRNSVVKQQHDKVGVKRKHSIGSSQTFEFDDMSDTYWTDRVIQNGSEKQPSHKSRKRDNLFVPVELSKPVKRNNLFVPVELSSSLSNPVNKSNSRKRYSDGNYVQLSEKPAVYVDENAPGELVMHFPVVDSVPSEINLNKMFRRFGPVKESETEIDKYTNRARVVFKKCGDAEVAYGSAKEFNIFGSLLVNYQLNYTISVPFKTQPVATIQEEDETFFLQY